MGTSTRGLFESIDPKDLVFEDHLQGLRRFDPVPEGYPPNHDDPFAPYFYCSYEMRADIIYRDAVALLEEFNTSEISEVRKIIKLQITRARKKYVSHIRAVLPGRSISDYKYAAKAMPDVELLRMFPPEDCNLSTGKRFEVEHLWAVYAIEEIASALKLLSLPMFPRNKKELARSPYIGDMLSVQFEKTTAPLSKSKRDEAVMAAHRYRAAAVDAASHLTYASQHLQYAMLTIFSNSLKSKHERDEFIKNRRMRGLSEINNLKSAASERAQALAIDLWGSDSSQAIRISEMADKVYRLLVDEGYQAALPETSERLREWIKPVAPDYARKGGRRRKTS
ncbi:hypothetical protein [Phytopseudomonas dryadis]|uniref:hypothetical protein n=1 Tax=Pseudomonadaceae TaxID=135621 RepID=UPI001037691A|nr:MULTISPECIES: hypothetical protein [Pseudomonas]